MICYVLNLILLSFLGFKKAEKIIKKTGWPRGCLDSTDTVSGLLGISTVTIKDFQVVNFVAIGLVYQFTIKKF